MVFRENLRFILILKTNISHKAGAFAMGVVAPPLDSVYFFFKFFTQKRLHKPPFSFLFFSGTHIFHNKFSKSLLPKSILQPVIFD